MNKEEAKEYLLSKPFAKEEYPFDFVTPVFKVGGKMFALMSAHESDRSSINLKNTPDDNILLQELYDEVVPGYHQNKTHWITVYIDRTLNDKLIKRLIDDSYNIVYNSLTKKIREQLSND